MAQLQCCCAAQRTRPESTAAFALEVLRLTFSLDPPAIAASSAMSDAAAEVVPGSIDQAPPTDSEPKVRPAHCDHQKPHACLELLPLTMMGLDSYD